MSAADPTTPMRITFVLPPVDKSGGIRVVATYAQRLAERGHRVKVVSTRQAVPFKRAVKNLLKGRGYRRLLPSLPSYFDGIELDYEVVDHAGPITDADVPDADVVVATWWKTAYWVRDLSPSKGAKAYFVQGDERGLGGSPSEVQATWDMPLHKIVVARWLQTMLQEHGIDHPVELAPNAVDTDQFSAPPRSKQATPTVGLVHTDLHCKGTDIGLEAIRIARQQRPDLRVVAFGRHELSEALALPDDATFHQDPPQREIAEIYAACDAWLFPSRREGYGLPILEAMACRTPVVAAPAGAAPELMEGGGGLLVGPEDPQAMAKALLEVVQLDEDAWHAMSDRALATAHSLNWSQATQVFEQTLRRAIEAEASDGDLSKQTPADTPIGTHA